jgi:ATP phosphoribosyltransferase
VIEIKGERIWGDNEKVRIVFSEGDTESTVWAGFTDLAFDNTQTGTTIVQYGLRVLEEKGTSSACLYMSPLASKDPKKMEEIMLIKSKLEGVALAQKFKYIVFNVENKNLQPLLNELRKKKLYAHELVPRKGKKYSEISIEIPISSYPELDAVLKKFNVKDVITLSPERLIPDYGTSDSPDNNT